MSVGNATNFALPLCSDVVFAAWSILCRTIIGETVKKLVVLTGAGISAIREENPLSSKQKYIKLKIGDYA